jgi:ATP synthase protein I
MTMQPEDTEQSPEYVKNLEEKQGLEDIGLRMANLRDESRKPSKIAMNIKAPPSNVLGLAFRVAVELVSALVVGAIIGWSLDYWLDTRPWIMLVFVVLGGAAGVLNVYRLASSFATMPTDPVSETDNQDNSGGDLKER